MTSRAAQTHVFNEFLTFLKFGTFLTFHFGAEEPGSGGPRNPGGTGSPRNPGRGQARTSHRLLWNTVRTPYRQSLIGEKCCFLEDSLQGRKEIIELLDDSLQGFKENI